MKQQIYNIKNNSKSLWLLLLFYSLSNSIAAQYNLVPNYSFENYTICPMPGYGPLPNPWYKPTSVYNQTGAYANACDNSPYGSVPINTPGYQYAKTGQAYAFYVAYQNFVPANSLVSYIQTVLKDSLRHNKRYYVEFFINSANIGRYGCNNNAMLFTKTPIYTDTINDPDGVILANPQIMNYGNPIILDTVKWVKVSGVLKAEGGEKYITIGNFKLDYQTKFDTLYGNPQLYAGYYLDDVSVIPLDSMCLKADAGRDTTIKVGDSVFIGSYTNGIDTIKWYNSSGQLIDSTRPGFWYTPSTTGTSFFVLQQIVNGCYSSDTVYINAVLPLTMLDVRCKMLDIGRIEVSWNTANEVNVSHYNIEHSIDGRYFTVIGKVKANNKNYNEYNFTDENVNEGMNYYRVVGIDKDGKKTYSVVRKIEYRISNNEVNIYPNPSKGYINISSIKNIQSVEVTNYLGQIIHFKNNINHSNYIVNLTYYPKGLYFVKVLECNSGKQEVKKVILE